MKDEAAEVGSGRRGTRTPSRDVRVALTDAAEAVLMRDGPGAVTVRAVAAEAGVAPMGVYNRFGSKEGLFEALLMRGFEGLEAAVSAREGEHEPLLRLWGSGLRYRRFALARPSLYVLMFGSRRGGEELSDEFLACADGAFQVLVDHVALVIASGRFVERDPVAVARQVWSAVHGAVSLEIVGMMDEPEMSYRQTLMMVMRAFADPEEVAYPDPDGPPVWVRADNGPGRGGSGRSGEGSR